MGAFLAQAKGERIICFSANASILAGITLLGIGTVTVRRADRPSQLAYAIIPLAFGLQQLVEGYLWLVLPTQSQATNVATTIYLLFSHVLWPILVPFAVLMIEPVYARRKRLMIPMTAGTFAGIYFLMAVVTEPVSALIEGKHIIYHLPHRHDTLILMLYVVGTCVTPLLSSHKTVRLFGIMISISMIVAGIAYMNWFASVWCFFAALTSGIIYLHFSQHRFLDNKVSISGAA